MWIIWVKSKKHWVKAFVAFKVRDYVVLVVLEII